MKYIDCDFSEYLRSPKDYPLYGGMPLNKKTAAYGEAVKNRILRDLFKTGALVPISE